MFVSRQLKVCWAIRQLSSWRSLPPINGMSFQKQKTKKKTEARIPNENKMPNNWKFIKTRCGNSRHQMQHHQQHQQQQQRSRSVAQLFWPGSNATLRCLGYGFAVPGGGGDGISESYAWSVLWQEQRVPIQREKMCSGLVDLVSLS